MAKFNMPAKVNYGIVKFSLKKLLELHMPSSIIYGNKSGLTPKIENYIKNQNIFTGSLINKNKVIRLLENLPTIERYSDRYAIFFGAYFLLSYGCPNIVNYLPIDNTGYNTLFLIAITAQKLQITRNLLTLRNLKLISSIVTISCEPSAPSLSRLEHQPKNRFPYHLM